MGCSHSKLEDEEAVQICKDRKRFIKQAIEHRTKFASTHIAYILSLRQVSDALHDFIIQGDNNNYKPHEFVDLLTPVKRIPPSSRRSEFITISPSSMPPKMIQDKPRTRVRANYLMANRTRQVRVEQRSPETFRVESFPPPPSRHHQYGEADGFFGMNMDMNVNTCAASSSSFWNPSSSPEQNCDRGSVEDRSGTVDDEIRGLRRVREEEGIPDLEEDDEPQPVSENEGDEKCIGTQEQRTVEVPKVETNKGNVVGVGKVEEVKNVVEVAKRETPGFTVYVNRRPTSMAEVIKDLEDQFTTICDAAKEVSGLLEASRAQYAPSANNDHSAMKKLNPVALFRSGSSRSSSSRFLITSSESRSDVSDKSCMVSGSHQTTLDKLFAWEKKLYDEVKSGERVRRAYEKKCMQLRNQDVKGDDPSSVDKTRATIRDLDTQIKVSIHSIESISKRIETLRDQELLPQLLELVQGLTRMWQVMAESHQIQKRTLEEAKMLLAGAPVSKRHKKRQPPVMMPEAINSQRLAQSALNLEAQHCLAGFSDVSDVILTLRKLDYPHVLTLYTESASSGPSYLAAWRRSRSWTNSSSLPQGWVQCMQDRLGKTRVGAEAGQRDSGSETLDLVLADEDVLMTAEKLAEVAAKVLCHGMSVAVSSLAEFAINSADEHSKLVNQPEDAADSTSGQHPDVNFNS
ncbi:hypothetical protein Rs2_41962 [Raphanus sativus]|nr:hypothetical protein Rs2_41962 [Raphanus sativus]